MTDQLAEQAKTLGIVNHGVPHDHLFSEARAVAASITASSPTAVGMTTTSLNKATNTTFDRMLEYQSYAPNVTFLTPEDEEGVQAFRERRAPDFAHAAAKTRS